MVVFFGVLYVIAHAFVGVCRHRGGGGGWHRGSGSFLLPQGVSGRRPQGSRQKPVFGCGRKCTPIRGIPLGTCGADANPTAVHPTEGFGGVGVFLAVFRVRPGGRGRWAGVVEVLCATPWWWRRAGSCWCGWFSGGGGWELMLHDHRPHTCGQGGFGDAGFIRWIAHRKWFSMCASPSPALNRERRGGAGHMIRSIHKGEAFLFPFSQGGGEADARGGRGRKNGRRR